MSRFLDTEIYNDRLMQTRRMGEKINDAIDKHNDLIEKRTEAEEEMEEKLQELSAEALLAIDEDIVAVLGGSGCKKPQSGYALCGVFLRHIFTVAGMLRIPLSQP